MAVKRPTLSGEILEGLSKVLGDTSNGLSNNEITKYLKEVEQLYNAIDDSVKKKPNIKK